MGIEGKTLGSAKHGACPWSAISTEPTGSVTCNSVNSSRAIHHANALIVSVADIQIPDRIEGYPEWPQQLCLCCRTSITAEPAVPGYSSDDAQGTVWHNLPNYTIGDSIGYVEVAGRICRHGLCHRD